MTVDQAEHLSALISDIYDAALDHSLWTSVLGKAGDFVGGVSAALLSKDAVDRTSYYDSGGIDETFRQLLFDKFINFDPAAAGQFFAHLEQPVATADLIPYDKFVRTHFFEEWVRPQGLVDFVASLLDTSATSAAFFGVLRHERDGIVDDETRRRMRLIAPHIRRAVLVGRLVDDAQTRAAALADTLDGLSAGVCLVDTEGRIVHANAAFHAILSTRDLLSTRCGRLVATDPKIDQTFRELFAAADRGGDASFDFRGTALPLTAHDGVHYLVHLLPLTSGARRRASVGTAAVAALFVHKASLAIPSPPAILARHYNLTPTELRVLLAIVEGAGVREAAGALGIADSTVRTHLGRLFEKTGASRQSDLVKIVAAFSTPLLGAIEPQRCGDTSINPS